MFLEKRAHPGAHLAVELIVVLVIESDHLLVMGDNAGLGSRERYTARDYPSDAGATRSDLLQQAPAGLILPDDPTGDHAPAQSADVCHHNPGAARVQALAGDLHHRDRRLWGDPLHLAPDVAVEHQVSNHQHPDAWETTKQGGQPANLRLKGYELRFFSHKS